MRTLNNRRLITFVNSAPGKVTVLLLLSFGTILFFNTYHRYTVMGPELLADNRFQNNLTEWEHSDHGASVVAPGAGVARLASNSPADIVGLSQTIRGAERYPLLKLACDIKVQDVPPGKGPWNTARVVLVSSDQNGAPMYFLPHALANLRGTRDWEHHEGVFAVHRDATKFSVSVQLAQTTGTMWVKNLSLLPLAEKASFRDFRKVAILLWISASLWIAVPVARSAFGNMQRIAIVSLALAIMFGVLMPENLKEHIGNSLFPSLTEPSVSLPAGETFKFTPLLPSPDVYKAGHFVMFAILAAVAFYRRSYPIARAGMLSYLILFALVTEILQLFVAGRNAQIGDLLIDSAGIVAGFTFLRAMLLFFPRHK